MDANGVLARLTRRGAAASALLCALLAPSVHAQDAVPRDPASSGPGASLLTARFSEAELEKLRAQGVSMESYLCNCTDRPVPHFPYVMVIVKTPSGEVVVRPEGQESAVRLIALALREGNRYCRLESDADCYGDFAHPCDFSDFVYGPTLVEFFPTCKSGDD
jgi:hypothetical protein